MLLFVAITLFQILEKVWQWPKTYKKSRLTHTHIHKNHLQHIHPTIHPLINFRASQPSCASSERFQEHSAICVQLRGGKRHCFCESLQNKDPTGNHHAGFVPSHYYLMFPQIFTADFYQVDHRSQKRGSCVPFCILPSDNIPFTSRTDRTKRGFLRKSEETLGCNAHASSFICHTPQTNYITTHATLSTNITC